MESREQSAPGSVAEGAVTEVFGRLGPALRAEFAGEVWIRTHRALLKKGPCLSDPAAFARTVAGRAALRLRIDDRKSRQIQPSRFEE